MTLSGFKRRVANLDTVMVLDAAVKSVDATVRFQPLVSPVASTRQPLVYPETGCGGPSSVTAGKVTAAVVTVKACA